MISFSTQPGGVALDGVGRNSPFAGALLNHIGAEGEDLSSILIAVRKDVIAATGNSQVPWENSALTDKFYFAPPPPPGLTPEQQFWATVQDSKNKGVVASYLAKYPNGTFSLLARALIEQLQQAEKLENASQEAEKRQAEAASTEARLLKLQEELQAREAALIEERKRIEEVRIREREEKRRAEAEQKAALALKAEEQRKQEAAKLAEEKRRAAEAAATAAASKPQTEKQSPKPEENAGAALKADEARRAEEVQAAAARTRQEALERDEAAQKSTAAQKAEESRKAELAKLEGEKRLAEDRQRADEIRKLKEKAEADLRAARETAQAAEQKRLEAEKAEAAARTKAKHAAEQTERSRERQQERAEKKASLGKKETHQGGPNCGARSCSAARNGCMTKGGSAIKCSNLYAQCMQTGEFSGKFCQHTGLARH